MTSWYKIFLKSIALLNVISLLVFPGEKNKGVPLMNQNLFPQVSVEKVNTNIGAGKLLDENEVVLQIIAAIQDFTLISDIYKNIPSKQLENMSFTHFDSYIRALGKSLPSNSKILHFKFLTSRETQDYFNQLLSKNPYFPTYEYLDKASIDLLERTIIVKLEYTPAKLKQDYFYLFFQKDSVGNLYLSLDWVNKSLEIYQLAVLYFHALEQKNKAAVASLIIQGIGKNNTLDEKIFINQGNKLVEFYLTRIQSSFVDFQLISLNMLGGSFLQPQVLEEASQGFKVRDANFWRTPSDTIAIWDSINQPLLTRDSQLYKGGEKLFILGESVNLELIESRLGKPLMVHYGSKYVEDSSKEDTDNTSSQVNIVVLSYPDISITVRVLTDKSGNWSGAITRFVLNDPESIYSLGPSIYVGMPINEFLFLYPFAEQSGFKLNVLIGDTHLYLLATLDKEKNIISHVNVSLQNTGA